MVDIKDYPEFETAWCPGCGNFPLRKAMRQALIKLGLEPHQVVFVSGIGQAAKAPHYIPCNLFNGLHGRALPPAQGIKLALPQAAVIVESGDGDMYGEGGNHFIAAIRRNVDVTAVVHDNQIYGLTKGQASPTTMPGHKTKAQPFGAPSEAFNPIAVGVAMRANFVARGFVGETDHLADLIAQAVRHPGFALVDVFQPCVSFNKVNTFQWYKQHCYKLDESYDPTDWRQAMDKAMEFGERIPIGVIYKGERPTFEERLPTAPKEPLARRVVDREAIKRIMATYGAPLKRPTKKAGP